MAANTGQVSTQTIVAASTVIIFRNFVCGTPELLMVKRSKALSFAASAIVFPGGKVSATDLTLADGDEERGARIAAVRETLEETGLVLGMDRPVSAQEAIEARAMLVAEEDLAPVLQRFSWNLDTDCLTPFARWIPKFKPGRIFDTRFYLANVGTGAVELAPDHGENTHLFWIAASDALEQIEGGELKAIYPTRRNLERLARFSDFDAAREDAVAAAQGIVSPWIEVVDELEMLHIPEGMGYPVTSAPLSQIYLD